MDAKIRSRMFAIVHTVSARGASGHRAEEQLEVLVGALHCSPALRGKGLIGSSESEERGASASSHHESPGVESQVVGAPLRAIRGACAAQLCPTVSGAKCARSVRRRPVGGSAHGEVALGDDIGGSRVEFLAGHDCYAVVATAPSGHPLAVPSRACAGHAWAEPEVTAVGTASGDVEVVDVAAAARNAELQIERDPLGRKRDGKACGGAAGGRCDGGVRRSDGYERAGEKGDHGAGRARTTADARGGRPSGRERVRRLRRRTHGGKRTPQRARAPINA